MRISPLPRTLVIGLGHKARQGKDTVAKFWQDTYGGQYDIIIHPFAAELKKEVNIAAERLGGFENLISTVHSMPQVYGVVPEWVQLDEEPDMTDPLCPNGKHRRLLQWWGTEFRRARNPFYWVVKADQYIRTRKPQIAIVPDVRFPNELEYIHAVGGESVRLERMSFVSDVPEHSSETALLGAKFTHTMQVDNNLEDLLQTAKTLFDEYIAPGQLVLPEDELIYKLD
jgi:hypothetical protein